MGTKRLSPQVKSFALDVLRAIGSPYALNLREKVIGEEWDAIGLAKADPRAYTSAQEYFLDAQAASLLRKCKDLPTTVDKRGEALENWRLGEVDCYKTNERLYPYLEGKTHPAFNEDVGIHIRMIREKIQLLLGRAPAMDYLSPKHGPGATFSNKSVRSTVADKLETRASFTHGAVWFLLDWVGTAWGREALPRNVNPFSVRGNRFSTAPKDAMKDRPIAAEPSINVFYQLALGQAMCRCLKKIGIDLRDGQALHRHLACEASKTGCAATVDLKNASDTVAYNLVRLLLPADWFLLLTELRSPFTRMNARDISRVARRKGITGDRWVKLEKFSSMGNGFTFELETILFWAISDHAVQMAGLSDSTRTLCYGDDIICDSRCATAVISALKFFGFSVNKDKTFVDGKFRESCGGDFWEGRPVRPYFLKASLDEPQQLIAAANQIRRVALDLYGGLGPFTDIWFALQNQLPSRVRCCRGPKSLGDIVLHDDEVNWSWTSRQHDRVFCYRPVKHFRVKLRDYSAGTVFACGLYGIPVSTGFITPRDSVVGYDVRKVMAYGVSWVPMPELYSQPFEPTVSLPNPGKGPDYNTAKRVVMRA